MATVTYRQALRDTLRAEMIRDENVFLMARRSGSSRARTRSPKGC